MKLSDFMPSICEEAKKQDKSLLLSLDYVYRLIDIDIKSNPSLANPLNKDPNVYYFRPREAPFSGEEEVEGRYFVFDYLWHFEEMHLKEKHSLREVEDYIVAPGGITNGYTACIVAVVDGMVKPYEISYFDKHKGQRVILRKDDSIHSIYPFGKASEDQVQIKWLD